MVNPSWIVYIHLYVLIYMHIRFGPKWVVCIGLDGWCRDTLNDIDKHETYVIDVS